jgi:hypothetical protein
VGREFVKMAGVRPSTDSGRVPFIDHARGLFLCWMMMSHALTLAAVGPDAWVQWLRPRGWSTIGFVMLTGFAVGTRYSSGVRRPQAQWYARAAWLLAIAVASNVLFQVVQALVAGRLTAAVVAHTLTLTTPWSISAILLAPALTLASVPLLLRLRLVWTTRSLLFAATVLALVFDVAVAGAPRSITPQPWFAPFSLSRDGSQTYFGFPVVAAVVMSVWAFALGAWRSDANRAGRPFTVFLMMSLVVLALRPWLPWPGVVVAAARFGVSLLAVIVLAWLPGTVFLTRGLALLSRYSLQVFLLHRIVLHAAIYVLPPLSGPVQALMLAFIALIVCLAFCLVQAWWRAAWPDRIVAELGSG